MDSPLLDQPPEPLLAFASEASVTPTADREPAFLRTPTPYDGYLSITSVAQDAPSETGRGWRVTTILVVAGVLAGFAGGYAFADRIIPPAVTPAHPMATAASAPAPAIPIAAPTAVAPVASSESATPNTEPSPASVPEPPVVQATQAANALATSASSAPRSTRRATISSSTTRPSKITEPRAAVAPTTAFGGSIVITSRPRGAQVLLDGTMVGQAPMSIANVSEGLHQVRVELDGFSPWVGAVRVKGGSRARVGASLEP